MSIEAFEINRESWDQRTREHWHSRFYDVDGFLAGKSSLNPLDLAEVGEVRGLSMLHLQCHFGLDTLSWARLGAEAGYDEINLNVGCPSDRVQSGTFGAVLMRDPALVAECCAAMIGAVDVEVTV